MTMEVQIKYLNEILKKILRFRLYSGREDLEMASMFPGDMDNLVKIIQCDFVDLKFSNIIDTRIKGTL